MKEGLNKIANTKGSRDVQSRRRLKWIANGVLRNCSAQPGGCQRLPLLFVPCIMYARGTFYFGSQSFE